MEFENMEILELGNLKSIGSAYVHGLGDAQSKKKYNNTYAAFKFEEYPPSKQEGNLKTNLVAAYDVGYQVGLLGSASLTVSS
jgi:hypothetical protein